MAWSRALCEIIDRTISGDLGVVEDGRDDRAAAASAAAGRCPPDRRGGGDRRGRRRWAGVCARQPGLRLGRRRPRGAPVRGGVADADQGRQGTVNLSNPRAIFGGLRPRFTRSRVTYEAYVVSR